LLRAHTTERNLKLKAEDISKWTTYLTAPSGLKPSQCIGYQRVSFAIIGKTNAQPCTAGDGVFSVDNSGEILLVDLKTNTTTSLVKRASVKDVSMTCRNLVLWDAHPLQEHGRPLYWDQWKLSPDAKYLMFQADKLKV
jgi:hypothetical protein